MLKMEFAEYGDKSGHLVVYFHGAPGSIEECAIFDSHAKEHKLRVICFDRFALDKSLSREGYYQQLSSDIEREARGEMFDLIGFSIGAHIALEIGEILNSQVRQIHLVSSAAPINAGDFINHMAGGLVFKLAMEQPFLFSLLSHYQRIMALLAPRLLVRMLFSSAAGEDKALSRREEFKSYITPVLKHCFQKRVSGYIRDVNLYVAWPDKLEAYPGKVHLWHGTSDNWSPFSMASYLCNTIPSATHVDAMEGLSHYSCLYEAAPRICKTLKMER
jgi:pimeloyl-ACP methyl ester carboxylesterase